MPRFYQPPDDLLFADFPTIPQNHRRRHGTELFEEACDVADDVAEQAEQAAGDGNKALCKKILWFSAIFACKLGLFIVLTKATDAGVATDF